MADIEFSPDQDMSNVSPQDVADAKARAKASKAYKKAQTYPEKMAGGGKVSSASKRADGCAVKGKTRGKVL